MRRPRYELQGAPLLEEIQLAGRIDVAKEFGIRAADDPEADAVANSDALDEAVAAMWWGTSGVFGRELYFPVGRYEFARKLSIVGKQGFALTGDGINATQLFWRGPGGGVEPMLQWAGCAHLIVKNLTCWSDSLANGGSKPSAAVLSLAEGGTSWNHHYEDMMVDGAGSSDLFQNGFDYRTLNGTGNNSEVTYTRVRVSKCTEACFRISGSQAKTHRFEGCSGTTSAYAVRCMDDGYGSTTVNWKGGTASNITESVFKFWNPGEPISIEDIVCEQPHRFIDLGFSSDAGQPLTVRNCRVDATVNHATAACDSMILIGSAGPTIIEQNEFSGGPVPIQMKFIHQGIVCAHDLRRNFFKSDNSYLTSPVNWDQNNTGPSSMVHQEKNVFIRGINAVERVPRMEGLDWVIPETDDFALINTSGGRDRYPIRIALGNFRVAAATATRGFTLPRGTCVLGMALHQNAKLILAVPPNTPPAVITLSIGSTPGGCEYLQPTDVSAAYSVFLANPAKLGINLTTKYVPGFGYCPAYMSAGMTVYVTIATDRGLLSDGLTGDVDLLLRAEIAPRWLKAA